MSFNDMQFKTAEKTLGESVCWSEQEAADSNGKKIYLGDVVTGELMGRDSWTNPQGKEIMIYKLKTEDGRLLSVWSTAMIESGMEEGCENGPVPVGSIVRFTHEGMQQGKTKGTNPYHVIRVEFATPSPAFKQAGGLQSSQVAKKPSMGATMAAKGQPAQPANSQAEDSGY